MIDVFNNENLGVAGCMALEGEETIIYSNPQTGDFLYYEETTGRNMLIGGLTDRSAKQNMDKDSLFRALSTGSYGEDAIGVIFCGKYILVITSETTCEKRPYGAMKIPTGTPYEIQLGVDAEE